MKEMNFMLDFLGIDLVMLMNQRGYLQFFGLPLEIPEGFVLMSLNLDKDLQE